MVRLAPGSPAGNRTESCGAKTRRAASTPQEKARGPEGDPAALPLSSRSRHPRLFIVASRSDATGPGPGNRTPIGYAGRFTAALNSKFRPGWECAQLAHSCSSGRDRTGDFSLFRRTLYQLSYRTDERGVSGAPIAPPAGFEPATYRLTVGRSAAELRGKVRSGWIDDPGTGTRTRVLPSLLFTCA